MKKQNSDKLPINGDVETSTKGVADKQLQSRSSAYKDTNNNSEARLEALDELSKLDQEIGRYN